MKFLLFSPLIKPWCNDGKNEVVHIIQNLHLWHLCQISSNSAHYLCSLDDTFGQSENRTDRDLGVILNKTLPMKNPPTQL